MNENKSRTAETFFMRNYIVPLLYLNQHESDLFYWMQNYRAVSGHKKNALMDAFRVQPYSV